MRIEDRRVLRSGRAGEARWTEGFWADRFAVCRDAMVPNMWRLLSDDTLCHAFANFRIAAGLEDGRHRGPRWHDGDLYKWVEAACWVLTQAHEEQLDALLDDVIEVIRAAQTEDGYLHTPVIIARDRQGLDVRAFQDPEGFEMYNFGHLMTAACAHHQSTGKKTLLEVAIRAGDFLQRAFAAPTPELAHHTVCPSHYMGAIDLYRSTGDRKWLALAEVWLASRGLLEGGSDDNQTRVPVQDQDQAVGHAVRANYLYAGLTDLCVETGNTALLSAIKKVWEDVAYRKVYITGACGAIYDGASPDGAKKQSAIARVHQAYGRAYQLPNLTAYGETCANVGYALWSWRLLEATGLAVYADMVEQVLYNSALGSISLDGKRFFYTNPLERCDHEPFELRWSRTREPYIGCFCCPPNIVRTAAGVSRWSYVTSDEGVSVVLYGSSRYKTRINDSPVVLEQQTDYPWSGLVKITVEEAPPGFVLRLRIPEWAEGATFESQGKVTQAELGSFQVVDHVWKTGDSVTLDLPMRVRLMEAHPMVEENRHQIAVMRGPLVYCLESSDLPEGVGTGDILVSADDDLEPRYDPDLLDGVMVLEGKARVRRPVAWDTHLYREHRSGLSDEEAILRMVPYYAWDNRGLGQMRVWLSLDG